MGLTTFKKILSAMSIYHHNETDIMYPTFEYRGSIPVIKSENAIDNQMEEVTKYLSRTNVIKLVTPMEQKNDTQLQLEMDNSPHEFVPVFGNEQFPMPSKFFPLGREITTGLSKDEERKRTNTFLHLAQLCQSKSLTSTQARECLLLLTTCRNQWYTINSLYIEARRWSQEGESTKYKGFGDALNSLRGVIAETDHMPAISNAAKILETTAGFLAEFENKNDLFFKRFEDVRNRLKNYFSSLTENTIINNDLTELYLDPEGPEPDHALKGPDSPEKDYHYNILTTWYAVAKPLTGLSRTFISDVLGYTGKSQLTHKKSCKEYIGELEASLSNLKHYGLPNIAIPQGLFDNKFYSKKSEEMRSAIEEYSTFCDSVLSALRRLITLLPTMHNPSQFPLKKPGAQTFYEIEGKRYLIRPNMFVLITDMRNSVGDRWNSPELKNTIETSITTLRKTEEIQSSVSYDDCRIIASDSLECISRCIQVLQSTLKLHKKSELNAFNGLRMACVQGDMLFDYHANKDLYKKAEGLPLDPHMVTIARAARIMELYKKRWDKEISTQFKKFHEALGDWKEDAEAEIVYLDSSSYANLPEPIRNKDRFFDFIEFKGVGPLVCWGILIDDFILGS